MRRLAAGVALAAAAHVAHVAHAAHPFITEDPGTQGAGRFEVELGLAVRQGDPDLQGRGALFSPQLSIGVLDDLDLIARALWLNQNPVGGPTVFGSGDMLLDLKWRFFEHENVAFAARAGLDVSIPSATGSTSTSASRRG